MLSKSKHLCSVVGLSLRVCQKSCREDYIILYRGITFVAETHEVTEKPELPDWVTISSKDSIISKAEDDDFVLPSVSQWIENDKCHVQDFGKENTKNDREEGEVDKISKILKRQLKTPDLVVKALSDFHYDLSESLIEKILRRFSYEWISAFGFFKWSQLQNGIAHSPALYNLMIDNLGKTRKFDIMWELVKEMKLLPRYLTFDTMSRVIRRLAKAGKYDDAVEAFRIIESFGVKRDIASLNLAMDALVKGGSVEHAESLFSDFKEIIPPTLESYNVLIHGWCKCRQIDKAKRSFCDMKINGFSPDIITYTTLIEAYCFEKDFRKVDATLEKMKKDGLSPNIVTYTIIMKALSKAKDISKALEIYEKMKRNHCYPDASFYGVFINALSAAGRLKDSDSVFAAMSKEGVIPDVLAYNSLIASATRHLKEEKALRLLRKMEENGCKPDLKTYTHLVKMFCKLKRMKVVSFLLNHMYKNDISLDLGMYSLLVNQLCKSGQVNEACSVLEKSVMKGFVPMKCTLKKLVDKLEKQGLYREKQHVEELMSMANN